MTTIDEQYQALHNVRNFLLRLLDPRQTPRVPKKIREDARARLKHYPLDWEIRVMKENENFAKLYFKAIEDNKL